MDAKNLRDLKKLVAFCRKNGVASLKMAEIDITLHPSALFPESEYKKKKAELKTSTDSDIPLDTSAISDEDLLFWSSAGIPGEKET